jgi:MYXO-CTERM domain-containing protein
MPEGRFEHSTVCDAARGMVFVIGGYGPFPANPEESPLPTATIFAYDVAGDSWDDTLTAMDGTRVDASAQLIDSDTILVAGGFLDDLLSLRSDLYDIADDTWTRTGDLPWERFYHASAILPPGRMCLMGGVSFAGGQLNVNDDTFDCYSNGFWIPQLAPATQGRNRVAGATLGDAIYIVGGVEIAENDNPFDPAQYDQLGLVDRYPTGPLPPEPPAPDVGPDAGGDAGADAGGGDAGPDVGPGADAGEDVTGGGDAQADGGGGGGGGGSDDDGCGCASANSEVPLNALWVAGALLGLVLYARRRDGRKGSR